MDKAVISPLFFKDQSAFRKWLERHHKREKEVIVGYYKVGSGKPSMTWPESVDQALCFGWIDGVRRSIDHQSYQIRFTPRKPRSIWSEVNIRKVEALIKNKLMQPEGLAAFQKRVDDRSAVYSYETAPDQLNPEYEKIFRRNRKAWKYFSQLPPSYRKTSISWIMSARQEVTRKKRLQAMIDDSARGINQWKNNKYNKRPS